ncbi:acyl transferase domain-containing protein [Saccharothrix variisporea]|uniref:6-deoxyerythronolide-B synthase n=1 Tax=Saccharothrix variisporea TaxID=543527 RepID=A0A495X6X8_9PSEU|nr:type I polyketide synthase [Saccharothrix variisporea]RKT70181.1 acyl transferase domain-containing protein [Saccharothrix variisporea]
MANEEQLVEYLRRVTADLHQTKQKLKEATEREPIAVVGIGCRFPGGVRSAEQLWEVVRSGADCTTDFPTDRGWDLDALFDPDNPSGTSYVRRGGFIPEATGFDAGFFGISPREALAMDPQQRMMLEASWEAFEHAGIDPDSLRGSKTGVFVGANSAEYLTAMQRNMDALIGYTMTGVAGSVVSGRVSYTLGLEGPAVTVDTACSSSLVAVHVAAHALRNGDCTLALAGGVCVISTPGTFVEFSSQRGLAPDGRVKAFASAADGTAFGEGVGVLVLEKLSDARRNGHHVLAIVRGSAVNQDGASNGLTAPNGPSQQRVIRAALANAGLQPSDVDAVEAHGTGTTLGDPVEAQALLATYGKDRDRPLWLGSVKSNLGHTQAAAGVAGVIKMIMALRNHELPPTLNVDSPSHHVDWGDGAVKLVTEPVEWAPGDKPRRAGVSSFGISGTNAHVVIEEAPAAEVSPTEVVDGPTLWVLSAKTEAALRDQAARLREHAEGLDTHGIAHALATTRARFEHRAVLVGERAELDSALSALADGGAAPNLVTGTAEVGDRTAFLFPGQGSQWLGMAAELLETSPVFAQRMAECAEAVDRHTDWSLLDVLRGVPGAASLDRVDVVQPALFAMMVSLAALWRSHGVEPAAVVGHSQGEIAAACVAGALSLEDAALVVTLRSQAIAVDLAGRGGMVSVSAPIAEVAKRLPAGVSVAAVNGPSTVVVSGDNDGLDRLLAECAENGVRARRIDVDYASHSAHVESMRDELLRVLAPIKPRTSEIPFHSTVVGEPIDTAELTAEYWYRNLRQTVEFEDTVRGLVAAGVDSFIEVSPHPVLVPAVGDLLADGGSVVGTLRRDDGGVRRFLLSLAQAHTRGVQPDFSTLVAGRPVALPTYAFQHQTYWPKDVGAPADAAGLGLGSTGHPLLGATVALAGADGVLLTGRLSVSAHPWLADHRVAGRIFLPGTAFVELAVRAGDEVGATAVEELTLEAPLVVPEKGSVQVQLRVGEPDAAGVRRLTVHSRSDDDSAWVRHATGTLTSGAVDAVALGSWPPAGAEAVEVGELYERFAALGITYGPAFHGLRAVWRRGDEVFAEVAAPDQADVTGFGLHPAVLDAALHPLALGVFTSEGDGPWLPFAWHGVTLHATGATALRVSLRAAGSNAVAVSVADHTGAPVVSVDALAVRPLPANALAELGNPRHEALHVLDWAPVPVADGEVSLVEVDSLDAVTEVPDFVVLRVSAEGPLVEATHGAVNRVLETAQAWLADERFENSRLVVLTPDATHPALAAVWGLIRSAQSENPGRFVLVEAPDGVDLGPALRTGEPQLALRGDQVLAPRLAKAPGELGSVKLSGTVLITGASGVLGGVVARHLATHHDVDHLVLAGRRGLTDELARLRDELDVRVTVAACDAADREALAALIAEHPPTAVVHTAGVLDDGILSSLTPERIATTLRPKVDAVVNLHELAGDVEAFVLFSSAAGVFGGPGQANYAAANAFVDAFAAHRRAQGKPAVALAWGMWEQRTGLTGALDDADLARMRRSGVRPLSTEDGLELFDQALAAPEAALVPVRLDLAALREQGPALVSVLRGLVRVPHRRQVEAGAAAASDLVGRLAGRGVEERRKELLDIVRTQVAVVLGHSDGSAVGAAKAFKELGFDSLTAVEFRNRLNAAVGLRLPATLIFDYPNPTALAEHLDAELFDGAAAQTVVATTRQTDEPIAIVGMGCRFPGGVTSPEQLWDLVASGVDTVSGFPTDRGWDLDNLVDPDPDQPGRTYCGEGAFLYDAAWFDAGFFGISRREALAMDPQQRLFLETSWEAVERAGIDPTTLRGSRTGVFAGLMYHDYTAHLQHLPDELDGFIGTGIAGGVVSGRVSYVLGLEGPAVTVDTACSSSLVTMHLAAQALRNGECTLALAGGVTVLATPNAFIDFSRQRALAPDGRCKSFAAAADGTGWGEGVGVLVLERLSDARRNGHPVLAVVRGTAVNQDGASNGMTAPNGPSQQRLIRQALADAGLRPSDVDAVEAHGTGTTLGDPIEAQSLLATYGRDRGDHPLWLGSIKSNIGHTQAAAGVAGVIKVVEAIRHGVLPATLHVDEPSPHVDWADGAVRLLTESVPWPETGRPRRAGVSSFGISGTNAHAIIEQAPDSLVPVSSADLPVVPLVVSGRDREALRAQAARLLSHPADDPADLGFSLATTRTAFRHRAVVVGTPDELRDRLAALSRGESVPGVVEGVAEDSGTAFLFTGQGAQRLGMGADLRVFPAFAAAFDAVCAELDQHLDRPLREVLVTEDLHQTGYTQPALFAFEVALFRLVESWGVRPDFVAGHSIGELAAAHVAGVFSLADAARLVAARGRLMQALPTGGAMVAVQATEDEVTPLLTSGVAIAAINGPVSIVLSGAEADTLAVAAELAARGRKTKRLTVSHAFHSPLMEPMLADFRAVAETVTYHEPTIGILPAVTDAEYWVRQVREPVRFAEAVRELAGRGVKTFLELGPDAVLTAMGQESVADAAFVPAQRKDRTGPAVLTEAVARLHSRGVTVDWAAFFAGARRVDLPTYAFQRTRLWPDAPVQTAPTDDFWAAVDRADLGSLLGLDDSASLKDVVAALAAYRRGPEPGHQVRWRPVAGLPTASLHGIWLVPADAEQVGEALARAGAEVRHYTAPTAEALLALAPDRIVSGVLATTGSPAALLAELAEARLDTPVWYLTRAAVAVTPTDRITDLTGAAVWGYARRAAVETPRAWGGVIDLPEALDDRSLTALTAVLTKGAGEDQVAVRPAGVFARRLLTAPAAAPWTPTGPVAVHGGPLADRIAVLLDEAGVKVTTGAAETLVVTSDADDPIATAQVSDATHLLLVSTVDELFGVSGSPEIAATFDALAHQRSGAVSITVDVDARNFLTTVADGRVAGVPDWGTFVPGYTEFRPSPLLAELPDALRHATEADDGGGADIDSPAALRRLLDGADEEQARSVLSHVVRTQTAFTLGLPSAAGVDDHEEFLEIGFSSLTAVELRRRLEALTGLELSAALVYDCPTPAEVVEHLLGDRALVAELSTRDRQAA